MIYRRTESGRCYGMEMNVVKTNVMRISREPSTVQILIGQKQLKSLEYFNCLCSTITNNARCTREIKFRIVMAKAAFNRKNTLFISKLDLNLREKLVKCCIWSSNLDTSESRSEMPGKFWRLRRMEKIRWTNDV
jgi:hypothetical protein